MALVLATSLLLTPAVAFADGYSPLGLPDRGDGPPAVQGENTDGQTNGQASPSATPSDTPEQEAEPGSVSGAIKEIRDGKLVMEVDGQDQEVAIPEDLQITRDGQDVNLDQLENVDVATIERNDEGEITEVRVASKQSMDFWRSFLPILLVVLVGFYLLSRRRGAQPPTSSKS